MDIATVLKTTDLEMAQELAIHADAFAAFCRAHADYRHHVTYGLAGVDDARGRLEDARLAVERTPMTLPAVAEACQKRQGERDETRKDTEARYRNRDAYLGRVQAGASWTDAAGHAKA